VSVLRGVSFGVERGERVGIVGGRASGKTTLLHCIAGLRRPDAGSVEAPALADGSLLLLDEGQLECVQLQVSHSAALVVFASEAMRLVGRVDRLLALRDGRISRLEPRAARRVAEGDLRPGAVGVG
jgi:predicted ABC-type transport system involved in lysophospholipase L1 biosynthesis ATPase subunit